MLGQIGQLVVSLDVKTMAEQWKGYAHMAFQYVEHLKPRLDVADPLQFLAMDISNSIERVIEMVSTRLWKHSKSCIWEEYLSILLLLEVHGGN
jgi:hypothetical protein